MKMQFDESMSMEKILMWRRIIHLSLKSLSDRQKQFIPDIYIYTTLTKSISETFNISHPGCDKICQKLFKDGTWAFAFLQTPSLRNDRIKKSDFKRAVFASSRHELTPDMSPEIVVMHELMHFWIFEGLKIPFNVRNEEDVEVMCNEHAIACYVSLMARNPQYTTHSADRVLMDIEGSIRKVFESYSRELDEERYEFVTKATLGKVWGEDHDCIRNR
jgi:hypothetical protein